MPSSSNEPLLFGEEEADTDEDEPQNDGLGIWDACLADEEDEGEDDDDIFIILPTTHEPGPEPRARPDPGPTLEMHSPEASELTRRNMRLTTEGSSIRRSLQLRHPNGFYSTSPSLSHGRKPDVRHRRLPQPRLPPIYGQNEVFRKNSPMPESPASIVIASHGADFALHKVKTEFSERSTSYSILPIAPPCQKARRLSSSSATEPTSTHICSIEGFGKECYAFRLTQFLHR
ncbi:hypothetical protein FB451DRAFT_1192351 [Mycena latifolia]|nr:hypothetical protein FB451DRAFT_1192351 [Mycena latifolia]